MHAIKRTFALGLAALTLAGCNSIERSRAADFDFASIASFAFKDPPRFASVQDDSQNALLRDLEICVQNAFADRNVPMVPKPQAHVVVTATLSVAGKTAKLDPIYTQYQMEEYEEGLLTIQVFDRMNRRLIWVGEDTRRLRTKARAFSGLTPQWRESGERRNWPIQSMVDRVFSVLPRH